ncbi:MAG: hypothetical protein V4710_09915 [Verrucomicrobiota bacterium]
MTKSVVQFAECLVESDESFVESDESLVESDESFVESDESESGAVLSPVESAGSRGGSDERGFLIGTALFQAHDAAGRSTLPFLSSITMFIHGTKPVVKSLGSVADFCPICRDIRRFELLRNGTSSHIYFIAFGPGKLTSYTIQCAECGVSFFTDPTQYEEPANQRGLDLPALIDRTFPRIREVHAARLALESALKQRLTIPQDKRERLLIEPFSLLNPRVETLFKGNTEFDRPATIGCLGTILLPIIVFAAIMALPEERREDFMPIILVVGVIGVIYTLVQMARAPHRQLTRQVIPLLARTLHPLRATDLELALCLQKCKRLGMAIGEKLKPDFLARGMGE